MSTAPFNLCGKPEFWLRTAWDHSFETPTDSLHVNRMTLYFYELNPFIHVSGYGYSITHTCTPKDDNDCEFIWYESHGVSDWHDAERAAFSLLQENLSPFEFVCSFVRACRLLWSNHPHLQDWLMFHMERGDGSHQWTRGSVFLHDVSRAFNGAMVFCSDGSTVDHPGCKKAVWAAMRRPVDRPHVSPKNQYNTYRKTRRLTNLQTEEAMDRIALLSMGNSLR